MPADAERTRVLIVEDESKVAELFEVWLADEFDVRTAGSGEAALRQMADREADVVLLDRQMPRLSGDEVAYRLDRNGTDAQVIMVTAVTPSPEMATLPVDDYILKPMKRAQLRSTVETAALIGAYDDVVTELFALTARRQALEEEVPPDELAASEDFDRLVADIEAARESVDDTIAELWSQSDANVFARLDWRVTGDGVGDEGGDTLS